MTQKQLQRLTELVLQGDFGHVRCLASPQLIRVTDQSNRTILMNVADSVNTAVGLEKCILYLLNLGADPFAHDEAGDTAAHFAARQDNRRLLALMPFEAKWLRNLRGATPLMEAALTGSRKCAKHLLHLLREPRFNECKRKGNSKREQLLGHRDSQGRTALDLARLKGLSELATDIELEMRLTVDIDKVISGLTAEEEAVRAKLEELARSGDSEGLRRALMPGSCDLPDRWGQTVLLWAAYKCKSGGEALWQQLLTEADPTCSDIDGISSMHCAAMSGNAEAASALIGAGAAVNARDEAETTPLMRLSSAEVDAGTVVRLLLAAGSDWTLKDSQGKTALDWVTDRGKNELAELLRGYEGLDFFDASLDLPSDGQPYRDNWDSVRLIGRGGFGEVHEVLTDKGIRCATKTIKMKMQLGGQLEMSRDIDKVIASERNLCQLNHVNIVRFLYIVQSEPSTVVLFMELLNGCSLEAFLDRKPLDEETIRDFSGQICNALLYIHSRRPPVIHRDINCSNIVVLANSQRIKLIDFGLSIKLERSFSHISGSSATPIGTLNFMAPELLGAGTPESVQYSRESDIWAFGCSIFQMASGAKPYATVWNFYQLAQLLEKRGAPALPDNCSAVLKDFYSRCTARDRKYRKPAAELLRHEFLTGEKPKKRRTFSALFGDQK